MAFSGLKNAGDLAFVLSTSGDGSAVSTGTREVVDRAGNRTVVGPLVFKVDRTPPKLVAELTPAANGYGWRNGAVSVHWRASDSDSGIDPATVPADSVIDSEGGALEVEATVSDLAGNRTTTSIDEIAIDTVAPAIRGDVDRSANASGWYDTGVTVSFTCDDDLAGIASCAPPVRLSTDGIGQSVTGRSLDKAGNEALATVSGINIDASPPILEPEPAGVPNEFGWYNDDVVIRWVGTDALSGIATLSQPADDRVTGEGRGLNAGPASITDRAGNRTMATARGINIDRTPPFLSGAPTTEANAYGWYQGDVTVHWTVGDSLSGIDTAQIPADSVIGEEGTGLSVGPVTVLDMAGNVSDPVSVDGINIDRTPPSLIGAPTRLADANDWYRGDVVVVWRCEDALSGLDGSCPADSTLTEEGAALAASASISDNAGNTSSTTVGGVRIDRTGPAINAMADRPANANGWYSGDVTVRFVCSDNLSGVASCPAPVTFSVEGSAQSVTGVATDNAGNESTAVASGINVDKTPPTVSGVPDRTAGVDGWYDGEVTIHWQAEDALSGIDAATAPTDTVITGTGHRLGVGPVTVTDLAGNVSAPAAVAGIKIDSTAPFLTGSVTQSPSATGWFTDDVTVRWYCEDDLSGFTDPCPPDSVISDEGAGLTALATIQDKAGNKTTAKSKPPANIDKTRPVLTGSPDRPANANGWYNDDVRIRWTATDSASGTSWAARPGDTLLSGEGQSLSAGPVSIPDRAGNVSAPAVVNGIKIDRTPPTIAITAPVEGVSMALGAAITFDVVDALSGVDTVTPTLLGGTAAITVTNGFKPEVGSYTLEVKAADKAGNGATQIRHFTVR